MKGIIVAGKSGAYFYPFIKVGCKQFLSAYDKRMIYYYLRMTILTGFVDILIFIFPNYIHRFKELFGENVKYKYSINLSYKFATAYVTRPRFYIVVKLIGKDYVCLLLGNNIFYGHGMRKVLKDSIIKDDKGKATLFDYYVNNTYNASKYHTGLLVISYHRIFLLPLTISRYSNILGSHKFSEKLTSHLIIQKTNRGRSFPLYGSG